MIPHRRRAAGWAGAPGRDGAVRLRARALGYRVSGMSGRVLILSWEYPPVIEGGLARHVRKLAEGLVRQGVTVDVLTRGRDHGLENGLSGAEGIGGRTLPRGRAPTSPRGPDRFVAWGQRLDRDKLAAGGGVPGGEHSRRRRRARTLRRAP